MIAFPQDNPIAPSGRFSRSWWRFFVDLSGQVGDLTPFTPVVASRNGTLNLASATSIYQKIGNQVFWSIAVNIFDNGTGATAIVITLPITTYGLVIGSGVHTNSGLMLQCVDFTPRAPGAPATAISVTRYDGTYPLGASASGVLRLHVVYEISKTVM